MPGTVTRREALAWGATLAMTAPTLRAAEAQGRTPGEPFGYSLNTSTIRGQKLDLPAEVDLAGRAGYHAIEPWISEIEDYVKAGGKLPDLRKRIEDRGLTVESAIGFFDWIVDDDTRRRKGLDEARRVMELLREIGGKRIAAPPAGAADRDDLDPLAIADRYRALLEVGAEVGVIPQVEVWGFSKTLYRLGQAAHAAIEAGSPGARILADVYHLHKGGSGFGGLGLVSGRFMDVFHMNDYPADPPREQIQDKDRVFPGEGVAPLAEILRTLYDSGFRGYLSLELFNEDYWKRDPEEVVRVGLESMKRAVRGAKLGG